MKRLKDLPMIKVAAIEGYAIGGGAEIAMVCDKILMNQSSKIGFVHIKTGIVDGWSGGSRLVNIVGPISALNLMLSGKLVDAKECLEYNIVNEVFNLNGKDFVGECIHYILRLYFNTLV